MLDNGLSHHVRKCWEGEGRGRGGLTYKSTAARLLAGGLPLVILMEVGGVHEFATNVCVRMVGTDFCSSTCYPPSQEMRDAKN